MKMVAGLLVVVIVVMVAAVNGSRAQPLSGSSVAFQQCLQPMRATAGRCRSALTVALAGDELGGERAIDQAVGGDVVFGQGDFGYGGDLATPDFWKEVFVGVVVVLAGELAKRAADRLFGGASAPDLTAAVPEMLFDPVR